LIETVNESNRSHAINYTALIIAMMQKGIITPAEWEDARSQATHMADQRFVELRDEKDRETISEIVRLFGKKPA
jgi:hypothetical protein